MMAAAATPEHVEKTFSTNARGTYFTVQKALLHLNDGASIILLASAGKNKGLPRKQIMAMTPLAQLARPEEIAPQLCSSPQTKAATSPVSTCWSMAA